MKKLALLIAALAVAAPALAQDTGAPATYREIELDSGFLPDPHVIAVRAGGTIDAERLGSPCKGFIARAPDVRLEYNAGSRPLILSVDAGSDTTLVVNGPDNRWYCDDDSGDGTNPMVSFDDPDSGRYEIWIGTYSSGASQPARLHISELGSE